jgi:hypothetical protein
VKSLKIICPNGHLGFAPIRVESFKLGVATRPDYVAADSGSGKIVELPVRDVVHGRPVKNKEALANPEALEHFRNRPELCGT